MKFSIIVPHYGDRTRDLLDPCIRSIYKFTDLSQAEVIVVSNGATEDVRTFCNLMEVNLVWFDEAIGYSRACNEGMKIAKGDYIVLLNNDVVLLDQPKNIWIDLMLRAFWDERVAISGPMMSWCPWAEYNFLIGFCIMIRKKFLDEQGMYDESFEAYGEDTDLCIRAQKSGWSIKQVPDDEIRRVDGQPSVGTGNFPIWHKGNESYRNWPGGEALLEKNRKILHDRYATNIGNAKALDGWISDEELRWLAQRARQSKVFVQIGAWHGKSSRAIADNLPPDGKLYDIDKWTGSQAEMDTNHWSARLLEGDHAFNEYARGMWDHLVSGKVTPLKMLGKNGAALLRDMGIKADTVFIDGGHGPTETKSDIEWFLPLRKEGGVICGHDYMHEDGMWPDVGPEVLEIFGGNIGQPQGTHIWYTDSHNTNPIWVGSREEMLRDDYAKAVYDALNTEGGDTLCPSTDLIAVSRSRLSSGASKVPSSDAPNIYDCFIFNNEADVLRRRLSELYEAVDRFVIVEATKTHSGKAKELVFKPDLFDEYANKITYVVVDDLPEVEGSITDKSWTRERHQRDAIMRGLTQCKDSDIIIISDVDEIPSVEAIQSFNGTNDIRSFDMELYYYDETVQSVVTWREAKILRYGLLKQHSPCWARYQLADPIPNGGRHLSYFGGVEAIQRKLENTAHREYDTDYFKDPERIQKAIEQKRDLFDRDYVKFK